MPPANNISERLRLPILQGVLPINSAQIPGALIAVMGVIAASWTFEFKTVFGVGPRQIADN